MKQTAVEFKHTKVVSESGNELFFDEQGKLIKEEPKQEPCDNCNNDVCCCIIRTQETLEEATERLYPNKSTKGWIDQYSAIQRIHFIEGAKWQQERMYSEEEVMDILLLSYSSISDKSLAGADLRKWFEQFKKK